MAVCLLWSLGPWRTSLKAALGAIKTLEGSNQNLVTDSKQAKYCCPNSLLVLKNNGYPKQVLLNHKMVDSSDTLTQINYSPCPTLPAHWPEM